MSTKIEWTDETWSPIRVRVREDAAAIAEAKGYASLAPIAAKMAGRVGQHCEHVSPGCLHCYAGANNHRCLPGNGTGLPYERRSRDLVEAFVDEKVLLKPLGWKKPLKIFVENQSDIFGEWVTDEMLDRVFAVMALCPQHTFQVLTKRPERMLAYETASDVRGRIAHEANALMRSNRRAANSDALADVFLWKRLEHGVAGDWANYLSGISDRKWPLANVWLGVSVENQAAADERIPLLLQTPAAVRFISAEPLLGPVDLRRLKLDRPSVWAMHPCEIDGLSFRINGKPGLGWVICGGESGPGARPMHPDWARGLRDQCTAAGVPFFFKQWGAWMDGSDFRDSARIVLNDGRVIEGDPGDLPQDDRNRWPSFNAKMMAPVGKKAAGRLLDGREWSEFPDAGVKA